MDRILNVALIRTPEVAPWAQYRLYYLHAYIAQLNKGTLDNSSPLLNLKLLRQQGQIIDVKCKKSQ